MVARSIDIPILLRITWALMKIPPVAIEINAPPVTLYVILPPKNIERVMNGDDHHKTPDMFDVYDTCCRCG